MKKTFTMLAVVLIVGRGAAIAQSKTELPPPPPPPPAPAKIVLHGNDANVSLTYFYEQNPMVSHVHSGDGTVILELKNGKKEKYDLANDAEKRVSWKNIK